MSETIIWKDIPGYEGLYQVSNTGLVKSCERVVPSKLFGSQKVSEKILKADTVKNGYLRVTLSYKGKPLRRAVHQFVAKAFLPNPENKKFVNHINGITDDNRVENLEWCTSSENERHSYDILGKKSAMRKLTINQAAYIRANAKKTFCRSEGKNIMFYANKFGVTPNTIYDIINNKSYVEA